MVAFICVFVQFLLYEFHSRIEYATVVHSQDFDLIFTVVLCLFRVVLAFSMGHFGGKYNCAF